MDKFRRLLFMLATFLLAFMQVSCEAAGDETEDEDSITYIVTFETNGGTAIVPIEIVSGKTITLPAEPIRTGYIFDGWYVDISLLTEYNFSSLITTNITLYAKWIASTYTVTYQTNGGSSVTSQTIKYYSTATAPTTTYYGYTFVGWYSNEALTTLYNFNSPITADITLYAKWSVDSYAVTFNSNGGTTVNTQYIEYNSTATQPTSPTKDGYTFAGWYSNSALTTSYSFATNVTANIILYAKWSTNSYTVTFESNGGTSVSSQTVEYDSTASQPTAPTKSEAIFGGWYSDVGCTLIYDFATKVTSNITLYARWTDVTYKVSFDTDGGSYLAPVYIASGSPVSRPTDPTLSGYTFGDWYNSDKLLTLWDFDTPIVEDITIYAKWYVKPVVTFETNGGSSVSSQTIDYNTVASEPTTTLSGYTFGGWYSDSACTTAYNFSTLITADITLYAKWYENLTIAYETNGGSTITSHTIDYNTMLSAPTSPTRTGYGFGGWYTDSACTSSYSFSTYVTADLTLYAKWIAGVHTVTFNSNGGSTVTSQSVEYDSTATKPSDPTREHYSFVGWYSDSACTNLYDFNTIITGDITLYAKWSIDTVTVSFNSNGSIVSSQTIDYGSTATSYTPTLANYTFGGWYTNEDCTEEYNFTTIVTTDLILYAKWIPTTGKLPDMSTGDLL